MGFFETVFLIWFSASISLAIGTQFLLALYLERCCFVRVKQFYIGVPGYLDRLYIQWCRENGRDYRAIIMARRIILLNLVAVAVATLFAARNNLIW
jgi:hypothetical protein